MDVIISGSCYNQWELYKSIIDTPCDMSFNVGNLGGKETWVKYESQVNHRLNVVVPGNRDYIYGFNEKAYDIYEHSSCSVMTIRGGSTESASVSALMKEYQPDKEEIPEEKWNDIFYSFSSNNPDVIISHRGPMSIESIINPREDCLTSQKLDNLLSISRRSLKYWIFSSDHFSIYKHKDIVFIGVQAYHSFNLTL